MLLFFVVLLGVGLFVNFGFENFNILFLLQRVRLIIFSSFLILLPLIVIKNVLLRIVSFVVLTFFVYLFEVSYGRYEGFPGVILIVLGIVNSVGFLVFLGLDYVKDNKSIKIILLIIFLILLTVSMFKIYTNVKIWNEWKNGPLNVATALQNQDCERLEGILLRNQCFRKLAIETTNPELCSRISDFWSKLYCLQKTVVPFNQERICSYFSGKEKDDCAAHASGPFKVIYT